MSTHRYILEPLHSLKFEHRRRKAEQCPCGKNNKDGKFAPYVGFTDRGHCHSCGDTLSVAVSSCPACNTPHAFSRYTDTEDAGAYLCDDVGKCLYCQYHRTPKEHFADDEATKPRPTAATRTVPLPKPTPKPVSLVPPDKFTASLCRYGHNNFAAYLQKLLGPEKAAGLIARYFIGTSKYWRGATVFYQIDAGGRVKAGKVMLYDPETGKRVKSPYDHINWLHTVLKLADYNLEQCFFGEHLLAIHQEKPVAIVESEKTALIASAFMPDFVWLASGGKDGLNETKCSVLKGRQVVLFPDLKCFEKWSEKAKVLEHITPFAVSDLLERKASESERAHGYDLADYLIQLSPPPTQRKGPEFYHMAYSELVEALGHDKAREKAEYYQSLSEQHRACKTYVLHTCKLLATYSVAAQP